MNENKIFVIKSIDYAGLSMVEGVYNNIETAKIEIQKLVLEINNLIPNIKHHKEDLFKEETLNDDSDSVIIRFSNNIRIIEIIELEMNKIYNQISSWYN